MKTFMKGKTAVVACGLALVCGIAIAKNRIPFEDNAILPGIAVDGSLIIGPETGVGNVKGSINTKSGAVRASIKGTAVNLSSKGQRFSNDAGVNAVILAQLPGLNIKSSKYSVGKPKKGTIDAKARGNVKGSVGVL